jgi:hypothetical protein
MGRRIPSSHPFIPERFIKAFRDRCFIFSRKASTIFTQSMRRNSINGLRHLLQANRPDCEEPGFPLYFPSKFPVPKFQCPGRMIWQLRLGQRGRGRPRDSRSRDRRYIAVRRPALHSGVETGATLRSGDRHYIAAIPRSFGHGVRTGPIHLGIE